MSLFSLYYILYKYGYVDEIKVLHFQRIKYMVYLQTHTKHV